MGSTSWRRAAIPIALTLLAAAGPSCGSAALNDKNDAGAGHSGGAGGAAGARGGAGGAVQGSGGQAGSPSGGAGGGAGTSGAGGTAGAAGGAGGAGGKPTGTGGLGGSAGNDGVGGKSATGGAGAAGAGGSAGAGGKAGTGGAAGSTAGSGGSTGGTAGGTGGAAGSTGGAAGSTGGAAGSTGGTAGGTGGAAGSTGGTGGAAPPNLVFVSSRTDLKPNLGNLAAYDSVCNQLATAAGINNATKDAFVALMGDSQTSVFSRLGNARGFVRTDGAPVADDVTSLFAQNRLFNSITADEHGVHPAFFSTVLTGLSYSGAADPNADCHDWTVATTSASFVAGCSTCGPPTWYYWESGTCDFITGAAVYCFQKTNVAPLTITPVAGKRIFVTNQPVMIGQDADAACASSKPSGTGTVKALRATTTAAASSLVAPGTKYVRPDGILVALGSDLIKGTLSSGIWQQGNGAYTSNVAIWTGANDLMTVGTAASTCANWTSAASTDSYASGATAGDLSGSWWRNGSAACNATYTFAYCIEQ